MEYYYLLLIIVTLCILVCLIKYQMLFQSPQYLKSQEIAQTLNKNVDILLNHLRHKYSNNSSISRLYKNYNPTQLITVYGDKQNQTYSVNKGEQIILSLNSKDGEIASLNTLMFVLIHELAHLMTFDVGHDRVFVDNMNLLLKEAISLGLYHYVDYSKNPVYYCQKQIDQNPLELNQITHTI